LTRAERIRRGFFRLDRDRTAAAHCGHALVKPGAPIGAPSSVPLLAVTRERAGPRRWAGARAAAVSGANLVVSYFAKRGFANIERIIKR
jgi:hypothetical protein